MIHHMLITMTMFDENQTYVSSEMIFVVLTSFDPKWPLTLQESTPSLAHHLLITLTTFDENQT